MKVEMKRKIEVDDCVLKVFVSEEEFERMKQLDGVEDRKYGYRVGWDAEEDKIYLTTSNGKVLVVIYRRGN